MQLIIVIFNMVAQLRIKVTIDKIIKVCIYNNINILGKNGKIIRSSNNNFNYL